MIPLAVQQPLLYDVINTADRCSWLSPLAWMFRKESLWSHRWGWGGAHLEEVDLSG